MNKRNIFILIFSSFLLILGVYFYLRISREANINIQSATTSYSLNAKDLTTYFATDEKLANEKFAGKIVKVEGNVKEVSFLNNTNTVILFGAENQGIICDFNQNQTKEIHALLKNQTVKIKGICKGFLKDVILQNCYIDVITHE
jgi:hypothetical protein